MTLIGLLHPGAMGGAVGADLAGAGHTVRWLPAGRGPQTRRRADAAGLHEAEDLRDCAIVLSICPPAAALATAESIGDFTGIYVDANAISPERASAVADAVRVRGATYVDGGIIGSPPVAPGTTRLYLAGDRAGAIAEVFRETRLEAVVLPQGGMAASALKMSYAAWTKISAALLLGARATARQHGIEDALVQEWSRSQPELADRYRAALAAAVGKGWRWVEEMEQIGLTFAAADQPAGFGEAAAEIFRAFPRES